MWGQSQAGFPGKARSLSAFRIGVQRPFLQLHRATRADNARLRLSIQIPSGEVEGRQTSENREGFPTTSLLPHAYLTPTPPAPPFFEPKILEKSRKYAILTYFDILVT